MPNQTFKAIAITRGVGGHTMYRANFYGPTAFCGPFMRGREPYYPSLPAPSFNMSMPTKDVFLAGPPSTLADKVRLNLDEMNQAHALLKQELVKDQLDINLPAVQKRISAIEHAKKLLAIIVSQGQKSIDAIVSNFR
jgi:hypothetical protein